MSLAFLSDGGQKVHALGHLWICVIRQGIFAV